MLLPLNVDAVNYGPPSYVNVCSDAFRDWLLADETWIAKQMASWYDEQYLHIAWDPKVHIPGMAAYEDYDEGAAFDEQLHEAMEAAERGEVPDVRARLNNKNIALEARADDEGEE